MIVGDLVRYRSHDWEQWIGISIQEFAGSSKPKLVHWTDTDGGSPVRVSHSEKDLKIINESR